MKVDDLRPLLGEYLGRQRWFAGSPPSSVDVVDHEEIAERLHWLLVDADGARYQLFVGTADGLPPEFLHGHDSEVIGAVEGEICFDGLLDGELAKALLARLAPDEEVARVRPMGAEQSNTSLVFDERLVLKVFRRIHPGPNPDIEVTASLAGAGFEHVAAPVAMWEENGSHLAVVQTYLSGGTDGWALALTSLRDYHGSECEEPAECGGDFAFEANRLGGVTARMHVALAGAFNRGDAALGDWVELMEGQLQRIASGHPWKDAASSVFDGLRALSDAGAAIRVHGDYHLGQVLRTDAGWFVLDFEGEPSRALDERRKPSSPLKDVAGMLRSFHYATAVALRERPEAEWEERRVKGGKWEQRNRRAFLDGYLATPGLSDLLPADEESTRRALAAWELDKAIYEIGYELDHRPDWADIPLSAIVRLSSG